jgi:hypothetical protein
MTSLLRSVEPSQCEDPNCRPSQNALSMESLDLQSKALLSEANDPGTITRPPAGGEQRRPSIGVSTTLEREPEIIRVVGSIRLMPAWTSIAADKIFTNQTFDIRQELKIARIGIDGRLSVTCWPTNITWYGGTCADFGGIVHVRLLSCGILIIDDTLCTEHFPPQRVPGGVNFEVGSLVD